MNECIEGKRREEKRRLRSIWDPAMYRGAFPVKWNSEKSIKDLGQKVQRQTAVRGDFLLSLPVVHFKVRSCCRLIDAPVILLQASGKTKPLTLSFSHISGIYRSLCRLADQRWANQRGSESATQPRTSKTWIHFVRRRLERSGGTRPCEGCPHVKVFFFIGDFFTASLWNPV